MARIIRIEDDPKRRSHRVLILENETVCGPYHAMSLLELSVKPGTAYTDALHCGLTKHEEDLNAYEQGLTYLERGARSKRELVRYLKRKGFSETACQVAVGRLSALELLSDELLARRLVEQASRQTISNRGVAARLTKRGIDGRTAQDTLRGAERDEEQAAVRLALKKFPELLRRAEKRVERMKHKGAVERVERNGEVLRHGLLLLGQYLARRGFKHSTVSHVVEQIGSSQGEENEGAWRSDDAEFE